MTAHNSLIYLPKEINCHLHFYFLLTKLENLTDKEGFNALVMENNRDKQALRLDN